METTPEVGRLKLEGRKMKSALDVKVGVKPVFGQLIHSDAWEGPCRTGTREELTPEAERAKAQKAFQGFQKELRGNLSAEARLLEPVYIEYGEDFAVDEKEFKKLESDLQNVDLFLLSYRVPGIERYMKPAAMVGRGITNVDIAAYLRSRGVEGYAPIDYGELNELISMMQVRKSIEQTKILAITGGELITWGVVSSIWNLEDLKARFGTDCQRISITSFFDEMGKVDQRKAAEIAGKLIEGAQKLNLNSDYVTKDVGFYLATRNLMEKYDCNAHTTPCFELCSTRLPEKYKVVPCLTHTFLKDEGYPSACEGDISVLMATMVLMYLSKKSAFMGNPSMKDENTIQVTHSVPGLKMNGFDKPDLPYELWHFTAAGWGTKVQIDLARNEEKEVTLARFNPSATKILVVKGRTVACRFNETACSPTVDIEVKDAREVIHQQADFGHHLAMVYGDYVSKIEKLSTLMDFKVVKA
jgi:L-fucose isomerase-like protein